MSECEAAAQSINELKTKLKNNRQVSVRGRVRVRVRDSVRVGVYSV